MKTFKKLADDKYYTVVIDPETEEETQIELEEDKKPVEVIVSTADRVSETTLGELKQNVEQCRMMVSQLEEQLEQAQEQLVIAEEEETEARIALELKEPTVITK